MKRLSASLVVAVITFGSIVGVRSADAQITGDIPGTSAADQKLELTGTQKNAIYAVVSKDKNKRSPVQFPAVVGADVPPMIELYSLPDEAVRDNPTAKLYKCTMVQGQVVVVDPTKMRVVEVIGPTSAQ